MNRPLALFLDRASLCPDDLDFSALAAVADWQWFDNANPADIPSSLKQAEIIVSNKVQLNAKVLAGCGQLRLICVAATGVNNIDVASAKKLGIAVSNVRGYATASVAQHVFSLILTLNRKLFSYQRDVIAGAWSHSEFFCYFGSTISDLENKTIGIIGYGELGQAVARIAKSFSMRVLIARRDKNDLREDRLELSTLLAESDVVSLHCPLTPDNYHLIGEREFALMKSDAIIINTARGGLIDEQALLFALESNVIGAAGVDVLEQEPPSVEHVLLKYRADNLIITPHIAWASCESRQRLIDEIAKNIEAYRHGHPRNVI